MIESVISLLAFFGGLLAHQTEPTIMRFPPRWQLMLRYIVGILTVDIFTMLMLRRLSKHEVRDFVAATTVVNMSVGLGVGVGHLIDDSKAVNNND
jgi:hypothetical protein